MAKDTPELMMNMTAADQSNARLLSEPFLQQLFSRKANRVHPLTADINRRMMEKECHAFCITGRYLFLSPLDLIRFNKPRNRMRNMSVQTQTQPTASSERKINPFVTKARYSVAEYRSQNGAIIVITGNLKQAIDPGAENISNRRVTLREFIVSMIARHDNVIVRLATRPDEFDHILQQFESRNSLQSGRRVSEHMQVSELQDASDCHKE